MTRTLIPLAESCDPDPDFNVVIAYEDFETGKHAKKTYDFLVEHLALCRFANQMWKFEVLSIPKLREMAARDAAEADIVMISCHGTELPPEVRAWIELWMDGNSHPFALAALFDCPTQLGQCSEVRSYLAGVAKRGQMEFFAQPDIWPGQSRPEAVIDLEEKKSDFYPAASAFAGMGWRDSGLQHWGINE